jgi:hypothetical protein
MLITASRLLIISKLYFCDDDDESSVAVGCKRWPEFGRRALRVPETVPFRLTRDMVDLMGAWGIDGLFTATCTRTMTFVLTDKSVLLA